MTSQISRENWLLNPELLKLVRECRRQVQSEFGVKLHLTETRLPEKLAHFSGQSRSKHLPRIWSAITDKVPELLMPACEKSPKRMYRGQEVVVDAPATQAKTESKTPRPRRTKVIYRGQEVI